MAIKAKCLLLGIFTFLFSVLSSAQPLLPVEYSDWFVNHFTMEDGLPSNEIYDLEVDEQGQLWICTDNGICSYDGTKFKTHNVQGVSQVVLGVEKDQNNNLWFWTVNNEILKLDNDSKEISIQFPNKYIKKMPTSGIITDLTVNSNHISYKAEQLVVIDNFQEPKNSTIYKFNINDPVSIPGITNNEFIAFSRITSPEQLTLKINTKDTQITRTLISKLITPDYNRLRTYNTKNEIYLTVATELLKLDKKKLSFYSKSIDGLMSPSLEQISDSSLWVGLLPYGALQLSSDSFQILNKLLYKKTISAIQQDFLKNLWFATHNSGLILMLNPHVYHFSSNRNNERVTHINHNKDKLLIGTYGGSLYEIIKAEYQYAKKNVAQIDHQIQNLEIKNGYLQVTVSGGEKLNIPLSNMDHTEKVKTETIINKGGQLILTEKNNTKVKMLNDNWQSARIRTYFNFDSNGGMYFGSFKETYFYDFKTQKYRGLIPDSLIDIRTATRFNGDTVLLGTKNKGLLMVKGGEIIKNLRNEEFNISTILKLVKRNQTIWFSTPSGVFKILEISDNNLKCQYWNNILGIGTPSIDQLLIWNNEIVLCTSAGIFIFNPDKIKVDGKAPEILAIDVKTIDSTFTVNDTKVKLKYHSSGVTIHPKVVSYWSSKGIPFRYRISTLDSNWTYTSALPIVIPSIPIGEHKIQIEAQNRFDQWSVVPGIINLEITPPYWQTVWFYFLSVFAFLALSIFLFILRFKRLKKDSKLQMEISESRIKALSVQLNPHFVFNSLNSVISHIGKNDTNSALRYLAKFAKLMRNIFENSQHKYVSFEKEILAVKQYLELELVRLNDSFTYTISVDKNVDQKSVQIPPLILQPIVENSIWHGIAPLRGIEGEIDIKVWIDDNKVLIEIKDNGLGGRFNKENKTATKKRSGSTELIKQRFQLMNRLNKNGYSINFRNELNIGFITEVTIPLIEIKN